MRPALWSRFPALVAVHGRRTLAQRATLETIAFALGGTAGARLATRLGSPISRATLLRLPWSNGQTEGQVNKLEFLKRQMYGRAKFDLLRRRMLRAA